MKKAIWMISILSLILTVASLSFMPDSIPMHYNLAGEIDRWGSKYESFIFPVINFVISLFFLLSISHCEKRAAATTVEKERAQALTNTTVLKITGVSMASLFTIMQAFILYGAYMDAHAGTAQSHIDILKVTCILIGLFLMILGNYMPKTKKNHVVGIRTSWSMYNDTTWMKSNRFGAFSLMIAGLLTIATAIFTHSVIAMVMMIAYLLVSVVVTIIYSHKIYQKEIKKDL